MIGRVFELDRTTIRPNDVLDGHFGAVLARPSPSRDELPERAEYHEESITLVQERGDRGSRAPRQSQDAYLSPPHPSFRMYAWFFGLKMLFSGSLPLLFLFLVIRIRSSAPLSSRQS